MALLVCFLGMKKAGAAMNCISLIVYWGLLYRELSAPMD